MKNSVFFLLLIVLCSCASPGDEELNSKPINTSAILNIKDSNGENFLDKIDPDKTELYYEKDGKLNLISYKWDTPKGYVVVQEPPVNEKIIKIFCYVEGNRPTEKTYIKWSNNVMDTLSYDVSRIGNGITLNNITFNSKSISNNNQYGIFNIKK